jgi:DGQHR domain-containing protein
MATEPKKGQADIQDANRLRYSVSLVKQGRHQFYTLTMPSAVLAETCIVTSRKEDPKLGFQRELDERRALDIANYIDDDMGTIPSSIVLSAQNNAELKIVGKGKTLEFTNTKGAFLILDGQHRVYGFSKAKTSLRVPVVIYNGLSRREESRLFIDINTKQKPVPPQLLLDIKKLAEIESDSEGILREIFDSFDQDMRSVMAGSMSPSESARSKITRVTFNQAVKPLLQLFPSRSSDEIFEILNAYLTAVLLEVSKKTTTPVIAKPVVFRAFMGIFRSVALRVSDRYGNVYTPAHFQEFVTLLFNNMPKSKLEIPGTSWTSLRDYLEGRLVSKVSL